MASAKKSQTEYELSLSLSQKEAEVLLAILLKVGGSPNGARGKAANILDAMREAGVDEKKFRFESQLSAIYFAD